MSRDRISYEKFDEPYQAVTSGKTNRVKEVAKKGKQKWRVDDLLADERCSAAVLDFLRSTRGDNEDEAEEAEVAEVEEQVSGVVTRGLLMDVFTV